MVDLIRTPGEKMEDTSVNRWDGNLTGPLPVATNARWAEHILLSIALTAADLFMVLAGFRLAFALRFESSIPWLYQTEVSELGFYSSLVFLLAPIWLIVFRLFGMYDFRYLFAGMHEYSRVLNACTLGIMLVVLITFFFPCRRGPMSKTALP